MTLFSLLFVALAGMLCLVSNHAFGGEELAIIFTHDDTALITPNEIHKEHIIEGDSKSCEASSIPLPTDETYPEEGIGVVDSCIQCPDETADSCPKREKIRWDFGDNYIEVNARMRFESLFSYNASLFNNGNNTRGCVTCGHGLDQIYNPGKLTGDVAILYGYGSECFGHDAVKIKAVIRTKGNFGNPNSIATTGESSVKEFDTIFGAHSHPITRHILWAREMWLDMCMNDVLGMPFCNEQRMTIGLFPFELGRGISLGSSYSVDPDLIGYYSPNAVDQFAPGWRLYGDLLTDVLAYDLYASVTQNFCDSFSNVNAQMMGNVIGCRNTPARGFGKINYIIASRLRWWPVYNDCNTVYIEPYALFNDEREQKVEFIGDAHATLGTFGLAFEGSFGSFECGFDTAINIGRQYVRALDRNTITKELRSGSVVVVNSHVNATTTAPSPEIAGKKALFTDANKNAINASLQGTAYNSATINDLLVNSADRFSDRYSVKYKGAMGVFDMSYRLPCTNTFKLAATAGFATGDENPHKNLEDPNSSVFDFDFKGFIGLMETYSGKRVPSAFVLSGAGSLPRVLSFPSEDVSEQFASTTSRFTNLIFTGGGMGACDVCIFGRTWNMSTNVLAYWQQHRTKFFDATAEASSATRYARRFLGTELNLFVDSELLQGLKAFVVIGLFIPGGHYTDIKGKPLNKDQQKFLEATNNTGDVPFKPTVGDNPGVFVNMGVEYRF